MHDRSTSDIGREDEREHDGEDAGKPGFAQAHEYALTHEHEAASESKRRSVPFRVPRSRDFWFGDDWIEEQDAASALGADVAGMDAEGRSAWMRALESEVGVEGMLFQMPSGLDEE